MSVYDVVFCHRLCLHDNEPIHRLYFIKKHQQIPINFFPLIPIIQNNKRSGLDVPQCFDCAEATIDENSFKDFFFQYVRNRRIYFKIFGFTCLIHLFPILDMWISLL